MVSGRQAYKNELVNLGRENDRIFCLEADLGGHKHSFRESFPNRFINVGIAEHSLLGIAAGLAENGLLPFASTFAPFASFRAAEMVRLAMGYMNLNIKLVCPYGGVSGAWFGPTHHCLEDFGIFQSFPNIYLAAPHGEIETRETIRWAASVSGPVYVRLGRDGIFNDLEYLDPLFYPKPRRAVGWANNVNNLLLVSMGEIGTEMVTQHQQISSIPHLHLPFLNKEALIEASKIIRQFKKAIVVEECRTLGGIASSISLLNPDMKVYSFSPDDSWPCKGGSHMEILEGMAFSLDGLQSTIERISKRGDKI